MTTRHDPGYAGHVKELFQNRGCLIKKFTNVLLHAAKMIDPRVKSQARGQIYLSRALK